LAEINKQWLEEARKDKEPLVYISDGTRASDRLLRVLNRHDAMLRHLEDTWLDD